MGVFTADQLCSMARSRERESAWSRRVLLTVLAGLASAFAYNVFAISQLGIRVSQGWMLAWVCLLIWRLRARPQPMSASASCAAFLQREFEGKRRGMLEIRRYLFLLVPPIVLACWSGGPAMRLRAMGFDPSSRAYGVANGPWPFIITGCVLVVIWVAFGLAARKATRELEELQRRI